MKRLNPSGQIQRVTASPAELELPDFIEVQARLVPSTPPAGDRPYYEERYSPYRGLPGAVCGLLLLIGFTLTIGAVSGAVYHHLQQQGGSADVRR